MDITGFALLPQHIVYNFECGYVTLPEYLADGLFDCRFDIECCTTAKSFPKVIM